MIARRFAETQPEAPGRAASPVAAYASTHLRMWVAAATTSPRWFFTVIRLDALRAGTSRVWISYSTVTVSPMNTGFGKRIRSYPYETTVPGSVWHMRVDAWDM